MEEREKALAVWTSEIERILSVMLAAFPQELRDTYLTTVVEQVNVTLWKYVRFASFVSFGI